jgi:MFS family permease
MNVTEESPLEVSISLEETPQEHEVLMRNFDFESSHYVETLIPNRLDRLPWSNWHWFIVVALGITWILDGLEVSLVGVVGSMLTHPGTIGFTEFEVGLAGSIYIAGAIIGSLFFGYVTDLIGRRKMNLITPCVYLISTAATAFSQNFWTFAICRFFTGAGIGGEYSSINSTIDELIPARVRGLVDLSINGSYWVGSAIGSLSSLIFLNAAYFSVDKGWRFAFLIGSALGVSVIFLRLRVPESPRWSIVHGKVQEAEDVLTVIESKIEKTKGPLPPIEGNPVIIYQKQKVGMRNIMKTMFKLYPKRTILGLVLMASQAFFYNAIGFTYALVLTKFHGVQEHEVGLYMIPFALGNYIGPLVLGKYFDTVGRKKMIFITYTLSAICMTITAVLFVKDVLTATTQTICWAIVFFFSSPAASAAYLTVSEIFPLEVRTVSIAIFYSFGTGIGGLLGPALYGALIQTNNPVNIFYGYLGGAAVMLLAGVVEITIGIDAEGKSLERIAAPLSSQPEKDNISKT